jgi:integrase/recombinase XerC
MVSYTEIRTVPITLSPHRIRHAAITAALDGTRDFRSVQRFSRHRDPKVILVYDDNREDLAGGIAREVASMI